MLNQQSFWGIYYCLKPFRISLSTAPFYYSRNFQRLTGNVVSVQTKHLLANEPDRLAERSLSVYASREQHSNGERHLNSGPMPQRLWKQGTVLPFDEADAGRAFAPSIRRIARGIESLQAILAITAFTNLQLRSLVLRRMTPPTKYLPDLAQVQLSLLRQNEPMFLYDVHLNAMATPRNYDIPTSSVTGWHSASELRSHMRFLNLYVYIITQNFNIFKLFHFEIFSGVTRF